MKFAVVRVIVALGALSAACFALAAPLEEKKWIEVRSEHFTMHSRLRERESIDMLRHLELLRSLVGRMTTTELEGGVPTDIYVVKSEKEFAELGADERFAGFFVPGLRRNIIVMHGLRGSGESSMILHEYVHYLFNTTGGFDYPKWYREGHADYVSAITINRGTAVLFGVLQGRAATLARGGWLPAEVLLDSSSFESLNEDQLSVFYAQSWLLAHYLFTSDKLQTRPREALPRYFELRSAGENEVAAFEGAFGIDAATLNERLETYSRKECCVVKKVAVDDLLPSFGADVSEAATGDVALGLAETALEFDNLDGAERWFRVAAAHEPVAGKATAGIGRVLVRRGRFDEAKAYFERAASMAPDDPEVLIDQSNYLLEQALSLEESTRRYELLAAAAAGYDYVESLGIVTPELLVNSSKVLWEQQVSIDRIVANLEAATRLMPSHAGAHADLAMAYASAGREQDAIRILRSLIAWSHGDGRLGEWARATILWIQSLPAGGRP